MPRIALRPDYSESRIPNFSMATLVNMYAERAEGKGSFPIVGDQGRTLKVELPSPGRGQFMHLGVHYVVAGTGLYRIGSDWGATLIGTVEGTAPARFAANSYQIAICGNPNLYTLDLETGVFSQVDDPDLPDVSDVVCVNGVGAFLYAGSDRWGTTRPQDFRQVDALDLATAESNADPLVGAVIVQNQLALFGTESTELWANTGEGSPPFDRAFVADAGCVSAATIKRFDGSVVWLGRTASGGVTVMRSNGGLPVRFATHAVERLIEDCDDLALARAMTYVRDGHEFYELSLTNGSVRVDSTTGLWTQTGAGAWPAGSFPPPSSYVNAATRDGRTVFQAQDGDLYLASDDVFTDGGAPLTRIVRTPVVAGNGKRITMHRLELELEAGAAALVEDEQFVQASISRDGGHTWTDLGLRSCGKRGDYDRRVEWRRLGQMESATIEFRYTGNGPFNVTGVYADIDEDRRP